MIIVRLIVSLIRWFFLLFFFNFFFYDFIFTIFFLRFSFYDFFLQFSFYDFFFYNFFLRFFFTILFYDFFLRFFFTIFFYDFFLIIFSTFAIAINDFSKFRKRSFDEFDLFYFSCKYWKNVFFWQKRDFWKLFLKHNVCSLFSFKNMFEKYMKKSNFTNDVWKFHFFVCLNDLFLDSNRENDYLNNFFEIFQFSSLRCDDSETYFQIVLLLFD